MKRQMNIFTLLNGKQEKIKLAQRRQAARLGGGGHAGGPEAGQIAGNGGFVGGLEPGRGQGGGEIAQIVLIGGERCRCGAALGGEVP